MRKYITFDDISPTINEINEKINLIPIIPSGIIMIWSGNSSNIPEGWVLCDDDNGTPNLSDKFVIAAGTNYPIGSTGGETEVTLELTQIPPHNHSIGTEETDADYAYEYDKYKAIGISSTGNTTGTKYWSAETLNSGGGESHNNMPPYYSLCYIMKL